jgi:small subunit ribosomal protein S27Ae
MGKKEAEQKPAASAPADAKGGKGAPAADAKGGKGTPAAAAPAAAAAPKGKAPAGRGAKPAAAAPKKKAKAPPKKLYAVQGNKVSRTKIECPKCGTGYFMAVHYNRRTCGKCYYTQFTDKDGNMGGPAGAMRQSRRMGRTPQGGGGGPGPAGDE